LIKQYKKLFEMEDVALSFTEGSLKAIAHEAIRRNTGARGLRAILESVMLDLMYEVPSQKNVREVIINEDVITRGEAPIILYEEQGTGRVGTG
jgi:ATP-dependent Clp protease ATP-binding subunit ClpX